MNHPHEDRLLLLAYGELPDADAAELETHLAACAACREDLERLERAHVALDWAVPKQHRPVRWIAAGLAAAAVLAAVVLARGGSEPEKAWQPSHVWSATAGYIAGGPNVVEIDAQLTRLEKERYHGLPN